MFQKATKHKLKLRLAISGPSGCGKTYTALNLAQYLGDSIAVIDTENGSASRYADLFDFDVCELTKFHPNNYIDAIRNASSSGYDTLIIDSLSHAWWAELNMVSGEFGNWKKVKPLERALIQAMLNCDCHIIVTMRTKTDYVFEDYTNKEGKTCRRPVRVGTSPIQTSGIEYEFDLAGEMSLENVLNVSKSRCPDFYGESIVRPGEAEAKRLLEWLNSGDDAPESAESKCNRVKVAREMAGLTREDVKLILKAEFNDRVSPKELSTEECDILIEMIKAIIQQTQPIPVTVLDDLREISSPNGLPALPKGATN